MRSLQKPEAEQEGPLAELIVVTARVSLLERLAEIARRRELLFLLTRKELAVRYKNSVLGMAWSMVNPAFMLGVWYFVFQVVLGSPIPHFAFYLMSGLLAWNFFAGSVQGASGAIVENAGIVKKVSFPRELLVLARVGQAGFFFLLQAAVLAIAMAAARYAPDLAALPVFLLAALALVVFSAAVAVLVAGLNVRYRDVQHFVELALFGWFFAVPVVYSFALTIEPRLASSFLGRFGPEHGAAWANPAYLYLLDPLASIVLSFERFIYGQHLAKASGGASFVLPSHPLSWYAALDAVALAAAVVLALVALKVFSAKEAEFAEEI
jgi:ABC-2 type transport system permease protein